MDKFKNMLVSASGKKAGPPVPPRPSPSKVQKALEKTRQNFLQSPSSAPRERTVIFSSAINNNQLTPSNTTKSCFDIECDDSSTGSASKAVQSGNGARVNSVTRSNETRATTDIEPTVALFHKSPVPRPRAPPPTLKDGDEKQQVISNNRLDAPSIKEINNQTNSYASLLMRSRNYPRHDDAIEKNCENVKNHDDELKQRLLREMMNKSNLVEAANRHVKFDGPNLKRTSSFDALNEVSGRADGKKVIFHEILISEISEMRRGSSDRAVSTPDVSQNAEIFEFDERKAMNTFVSLEDSGVEDEGKMDDCSSSGVGDSWDSCREMGNR